MPRSRRPDLPPSSYEASTSNIDPRLLESSSPQRRNANVSLSSTVGGPTPARHTVAASSLSRRADISLASTIATASTPAPKKRGRPPKSTLTTPAMRALTSDTSMSTNTIPTKRPRGRPPKSILTTPGSRTLTSPNTTTTTTTTTASSVSFSADIPTKRQPPKNSRHSDAIAAVTPKRRGRPPKNLVTSPNITTASASSTKRRGRPPGSVNKPKPTSKTPALGLPKSKSAPVTSTRTDKYIRPNPSAQDSESEVSLVDGVSEDEDDSASDGDDAESDTRDMSSDDEDDDDPRHGMQQKTGSKSNKKRKGWPSEKERLRKWRRLSVEERECVTSEGGLIWRTAIPLLNSMPKNIRSMVADSLTRALNRIDAKLESGLVPPLARIPVGSASAGAARRDLASSMLSWRLEEEGSLLNASQNSGDSVDLLSLGMNGEIMELEKTLLPEAEQIIDLSQTLTHQTQHLERLQSDIVKLKRQRRLVKNGNEYPGNMDVHPLLTIGNHSQELDRGLGSLLRT